MVQNSDGSGFRIPTVSFKSFCKIINCNWIRKNASHLDVNMCHALKKETVERFVPLGFPRNVKKMIFFYFHKISKCVFSCKYWVFSYVECCVFWPGFGCCAHPKAGRNTFFQPFSTFFVNFKPFSYMHNLFTIHRVSLDGITRSVHVCIILSV